jgi:hypothetical protein
MPSEPRTSEPTIVIGDACSEAYAGHRMMIVRRMTGSSKTDTMDHLAIVPIERDRCKGNICSKNVQIVD